MKTWWIHMSYGRKYGSPNHLASHGQFMFHHSVHQRCNDAHGRPQSADANNKSGTDCRCMSCSYIFTHLYPNSSRSICIEKMSWVEVKGTILSILEQDKSNNEENIPKLLELYILEGRKNFNIVERPYLRSSPLFNNCPTIPASLHGDLCSTAKPLWDAATPWDYEFYRSASDYDQPEEIYSGKASVLYAARCKISNIKVAVKKYHKDRLSDLNWHQVILMPKLSVPSENAHYYCNFETHPCLKQDNSTNVSIFKPDDSLPSIDVENAREGAAPSQLKMLKNQQLHLTAREGLTCCSPKLANALNDVVQKYLCQSSFWTLCRYKERFAYTHDWVMITSFSFTHHLRTTSMSTWCRSMLQVRLWEMSTLHQLVKDMSCLIHSCLCVLWKKCYE